jgi:hypothetical protein
LCDCNLSSGTIKEEKTQIECVENRREEERERERERKCEEKNLGKKEGALLVKPPRNPDKIYHRNESSLARHEAKISRVYLKKLQSMSSFIFICSGVEMSHFSLL